MTSPHDPNDVGPAPRAPEPGSAPARVFGTPRRPGLARTPAAMLPNANAAHDAAMDRSRNRLLVTAGLFTLLFGAVAGKLTWATVMHPMQPPARHKQQLPEPGEDALAAGPESVYHGRATIVDRNGQILAVSLPTAELYANPKEMIDTDQVAHQIKSVLPRLDEAQMAERLRSAKQFVYLARRLSPQEELAINALGIPGVSFQPSERRHYPQGRVAAQVLGGVDVDERGVAGVERFFDDRLRDHAEPLKLSLDVRVQAVVHDELAHAMEEFQAIGACGIVMDVHSGEVIAMVSLPDYDANDFGSAPADARFNRAVTGMYEPGSTFKLQTAAMALDSGSAQIFSIFDAAHDIHIGRFTITDFQGKHRFLYLPEVLAYSSNLGAAHMAQGVGAVRQRAWLDSMGMFRRIGVELPEAGQPLHPSVANWGESATMTVGFGHGIAVSPLHVVRGTAALANGGVVLRPTLLAAQPGDPLPDGTQIMQTGTSDTLRKLMRLVVTDGYGKPADVAGYFVGGKTGTAEKTTAHGGYKKHANVSAFMSVFPMNAPRFAVYMMLDEPHGNASTGGYSTAGVVSAPAAGKVIARIAPMLGMFPQIENAVAIQASLFIPMEPGQHPSHAPAVSAAPVSPRPVVQPASVPAPAPARDPRHEAAETLESHVAAR
jgi:cell division protein FtsI (penicillin-binding protein 3)